MSHPILTHFHDQASLYRLKEIGDGTHDFTKKVFEGLFGIAPKSSLVPESSLFGESLYDNFYVYEGSKKQGANARRDFRCKINGQLVVVETEKLDNIEAGMKQIGGYMTAENTNFGIVTDGGIWRFFKHGADHLDQYETLTIEQLCSTDGQAFLQNFYNSYDFYLQRLSSVESKPFDTQVFHQGLITTAERIVFDLRHSGLFTGSSQEVAKEEIQTAYSLIIQILLIKIIQDKRNINLLKKDIIIQHLNNQDRSGIFEAVEGQLKWLGEFYKPYHNQQDALLSKIIAHYQQGSRIAKLNLDSVRLFLDLYHFIYSFDFKEVRQDLFGAVYENYLKELYKDDDTKKGQVFTPPEIVEFMLDEVGYTVGYIQSVITTNLASLKEHLDDHCFTIAGLSLIDPACGSGTFLYKSAGRIVNALYNLHKEKKITDQEAGKMAEVLICNNIVGFDIEPFPLYLAEMNILQSLLFFNVSADGSVINSIDQQIKIFSTNDSIAEFHNLEASMEQDLQDLINGGDWISLSSKRDPTSILQLKADLQDFDRDALIRKFQCELYHKALQNPSYIVDDGELIKTKQKTYRDKHHKKILSLTSVKDLLAYVRETLDARYVGLFDAQTKIIKPQADYIASKLSEIIVKAQAKRTKFDFVVANPPYVKQDVDYPNDLFGFDLNDKKYTKITTKNPSVSVYSTNSKMNLYAYFVYLGKFLMRAGGKLCYITPRSIISKLTLQKTRLFLKDNTTLNCIRDFKFAHLFYSRGMKQNFVVGTDSCVFLLQNNKPSEVNKTTIIEYMGNKTLLSLEEFFSESKKTIIPQKDLFVDSLLQGQEYLIDYIESLMAQDSDIHYSIYPGIEVKKFANNEKKGYPVFAQRGYYTPVEAIDRRYDFDTLGAAKPSVTGKGKELIIQKKYRLTRSSGSYVSQKKIFTFSDYLHISNWASFASLGVDKEENLTILYFLFGLLNSEYVQSLIRDDMGGVLTLTNFKLIPIPLLTTPAKLTLKADLIANSEAIISLCKQGSDGGPQTRGDICDTAFDTDLLGEKITGIKTQYAQLGIALPRDVRVSDSLPDDILSLVKGESVDLEQLEKERDRIVRELYEVGV